MFHAKETVHMIDNWTTTMNREAARLATKVSALWIEPRCRASAEDGLNETVVPSFDAMINSGFFNLAERNFLSTDYGRGMILEILTNEFRVLGWDLTLVGPDEQLDCGDIVVTTRHAFPEKVEASQGS